MAAKAKAIRGITPNGPLTYRMTRPKAGVRAVANARVVGQRTGASADCGTRKGVFVKQVCCQRATDGTDGRTATIAGAATDAGCAGGTGSKAKRRDGKKGKGKDTHVELLRSWVFIAANSTLSLCA